MANKLKKEYLEVFNKIESAINKYDLVFNEEDTRKKSEIENFMLKILMIGVFNSGKSTLINKFLGDKKILQVNSEAETAVPCEIRYGTDEKTIVYKDNGKKDEKDKYFNIRATEGAGIHHIEKYIDSIKLKNLGEAVLVDMPGLDSSNDEHESAIDEYVTQGAYFILLGDPENGTIKDSTEKFLAKILKYPEQFSVLLTKVENASNEKVEEVMELLEEKFEDKDLNIFIGKVGGTDIRDFEKILSKIDEEDIFEKLFKESTQNLIVGKVRNLEMILKNKDLDVSEIEEGIKESNDKFKELEKKIEREKKDFNSTSVTNEIAYDLRGILENNISSLKSSAKSGSFSNQVQSIVSSNLPSIFERRLKDRIDIVADELREIEIYVPNISIDFRESISEAGKSSEFNIGDAILGVLPAIIPLTGVAGVVTTIAIKVFSSLFSSDSKSKKEEQEYELESQVRSGIEQAISNISSAITSKVNEVKEKIFKDLSEKCEIEKIEIQKTLESLLAKKKDEEEAFQKAYLELENTIEELKNIEL